MQTNERPRLKDQTLKGSLVIIRCFVPGAADVSQQHSLSQVSSLAPATSIFDTYILKPVPSSNLVLSPLLLLASLCRKEITSQAQS